MRDLPGVPRPDLACVVDVDEPGAAAVHRLWQLRFATEEEARVALDALMAREDGADPDCAEDCKAVVSGWVDGSSVLWVTTRSLAEAPAGCALMGRADPEHRARGMHGCG
jgi:hypothetical protein